MKASANMSGTKKVSFEGQYANDIPNGSHSELGGFCEVARHDGWVTAGRDLIEAGLNEPAGAGGLWGLCRGRRQRWQTSATVGSDGDRVVSRRCRVGDGSRRCDSGEDDGVTRRGTTGGRAHEHASTTDLTRPCGS